MNFSEYQRAARDTSQLRLGGPQGAIAPMLGLASETGSILNVYEKYLRDGIDLSVNLDLLREELGDLLWYVAAIATACELDLDEIAGANLERTRDRYLPRMTTSDFSTLPVFDANYPEHERFPRRLTVEFTEGGAQSGRPVSRMRIISAEPNTFPNGPIELEGGKLAGFQVGTDLGDLLTDNSRRLTHTDIMMRFTSASWQYWVGRQMLAHCYDSSASPIQ